MPKVVMYCTAFCPYCVRAKALLQQKGVDFEEIRVDLDRSRMTEMMQKSQRRTVPQIFIDDYHVGGFDDMAALDAAGRLDPLLGLADRHSSHKHHSDQFDHSEDGLT